MKKHLLGRRLPKLSQVLTSAGLLALMATSAHAQSIARIVGGTQSSAGEYEWMTALVEKGIAASQGQFCGASLIDPQWVVTAAHCVEGVTPNNTDVVVGAYDLNGDATSQRIAITEVRMHSNYKPGNQSDISYDIALLKLARPVNDLPVLSLVNKAGQISEGTSARAIGFGATSENGSGSSILREVDVPIVSFATANAYYGNLNASHLPAGLAQGGRDSCYGDSGGPLVVKENDQWFLAGVTSFGDGCGVPGAYGIYAHVLFLSDWIRAEMVNPNPPSNPQPEEGGADPDFGVDPDFDWEDPGFDWEDPNFDWEDPNFDWEDPNFDWEDPGFEDPDFEQTPGTGNDDHGDAPEDATPVGLPSVTAGTLDSAWDYDVFLLEIAQTTTVTIETTGTTDTYGYLDRDFEPIAEDDSSGSNDNFLISEELSPGTYYIWVEAFDPSTQVGAYELRISGDTPQEVAQPALELYEGDVLLASNANLDLGEMTLGGKVNTSSLIILNAGPGNLEIKEVSIVGQHASAFRLDVEPTGSLSSGLSTGLSLSYAPKTPGNHTAVLRIESNDPTHPIREVTLTGTAHQPATNDDHGDLPSSATPVELPGSANGYLDEGGDVDVFVFQLDSAAKVILRSNGDTDTYGILMDATGAIVAEDDDRGSAFNFRIRRQLEPGTYYLAVEGWDETISGDYGITLQAR